MSIDSPPMVVSMEPAFLGCPGLPLDSPSVSWVSWTPWVSWTRRFVGVLDSPPRRGCPGLPPVSWVSWTPPGLPFVGVLDSPLCRIVPRPTRPLTLCRIADYGAHRLTSDGREYGTCVSWVSWTPHFVGVLDSLVSSTGIPKWTPFFEQRAKVLSIGRRRRSTWQRGSSIPPSSRRRWRWPRSGERWPPFFEQFGREAGDYGSRVGWAARTCAVALRRSLMMRLTLRA